MYKVFDFIIRYAVSVAANLWLVAIGWLPRYRTDLYEAAYRLGWRKRPAMQVVLPPLSIPEISAASVMGDSASLAVLEPDAADGNVSGFELMVLAGIVRRRQPRTCFEIGTFDGRTTLNLTANMPPNGVVYTLDLPPASLPNTSLAVAPGDEQFVLKSESGARFKNAEFVDRITQLWGDSATFDYTNYLGKMDLVFVDGAHSYEYVKKDTETALALIRPGGVILWHDYGSPYWKGLTAAMNEMQRDLSALKSMRHIKGTSLVVLESHGVPGHEKL